MASVDVVVASNGRGLEQLSLNRPPEASIRDHHVEDEQDSRRTLSSHPA